MKRLIFMVPLFFILSGCAELLQLLQQSNVQKPTAQVVNAKLNGLSFSQADLLFDIQINNPNSIGVSLAGLDYGLKINDFSLFSGNKNDALTVEAQGTSTVQIPLSLKYEDIYKTVKTLTNQSKSIYAFEGGLSFDLPVLGKVRIPVSKSGELPLLRLPKVSVKSINMETLSWSGAALNLDVAVSGAGGLNLFIDNLSYNLTIAGKNWVGGDISKRLAVNTQGEQIISIPFKLDFLKMGRSLYDIVTGDAVLDYRFDGNMMISSDNPLLKATNFSFEDLSKIKIKN